MGFRYRVDHRIEGTRTKPDILFIRARVAVFVDGCFWHGCPQHGTMAKTNAAFWREKIRNNRNRDVRLTEELVRAGWRVLRLWSHEPLASMVERVRDAVRS